MKRIAYTLTCDRCDKVGATLYALTPEDRTAVQMHRCTGLKRPAGRLLKYWGDE